jgi:3-oxoacyl-[acyl-carrier-protein] synthase III
MAEKAARIALERAGLTPADVDAVLVATVTHPYQTPSSAALLAHRLGATPAAAMDISATVSSGPAQCRVAMPERERIHSSLDSILSTISAFVTTRPGR